jgi:hypothetical protein
MKPMRRFMKRREVIALDIGGKVAYFQPRRWDGGWYTRDINEAKVFRHPGYASDVIHGFRSSWENFNPRVISPRDVKGYVDKPTAAEKRAREEK